MKTITIDRSVVEQALGALENGKRVRAYEGGTKCQISLEGSAIAALRAALAEPVQEPVGAVLVNRESREGVMFYSVDMIPDPSTLKDRFELVPVYTTPPQRKPLPASEIVTMYDESPRGDSDMITFARAIERAHGIGETK